MALRFPLVCLLVVLASVAPAAPPDKTIPQKITPGQVVVPERTRQIFGEFVSVDPKTRIGSFRNLNNDTVTQFTVLPYANVMHHGANGDFKDLRPGEFAFFRLHENEEGKWAWCTLIEDEMRFLAIHGSYYWVDALDTVKGQITISRGSADKSRVGETGVVLNTDAETHYWKGGKPAAFKDIKVGDKVRACTHGVGKGNTRVCWEVFLDDESFQKFEKEQQAVHLKRLESEGLAGYVDARDGKVVRLSFFFETKDVCKELKAGQKVRLAPAGADRKPTGMPVTGTVTGQVKAVRKVWKVTVTLDAESSAFSPPGLARMWVVR